LIGLVYDINYYKCPVILVFMAGRTELEKYVRHLIALDVLYKPLSSLGDKGKRRAEKSAKEISKLLKTDKEISERIFAKIDRRDEEKARTLREGIDAFNKRYPKYGNLLEKMIEETRTRKDKYLVFGLNKGYKLSEDDYVGVMMDLGFTRREANETYPHIISISERLKKASEQAERTILISKG